MSLVNLLLSAIWPSPLARVSYQLGRLQDRPGSGGPIFLNLRFLRRRASIFPVWLAAEADINADLVVMATHGRTRVSHLVLGSVAEKVVRESSCPVLTVRMKAVQASAGEELKRHFHCFGASGTARVREIIVERRVPRH